MPSTPEPPKRRRKGLGATELEALALRGVLDALHEARSAAKMAVPARPYTVGVTHARAFLGRLRELVADFDANPEALLCAVVRSKVAADALSDDATRSSGKWSVGETICRQRWWASNLAAGQAWLAGKRPVVGVLSSVDLDAFKARHERMMRGE